MEMKKVTKKQVLDVLSDVCFDEFGGSEYCNELKVTKPRSGKFKMVVDGVAFVISVEKLSTVDNYPYFECEK